MELGTFSTVYKAIDVKHYEKNNDSWISGSRPDPYDAARLLALFVALQNSVISTRARKKIVNSKLNQCIREYVWNAYLNGMGPDNSGGGPVDVGRLESYLKVRPPVFVAIKRINATSGPKRITEELVFLRDLKGLHHIVPIITCSRWEDQVLAISPYFCGIDFRVSL